MLATYLYDSKGEFRTDLTRAEMLSALRDKDSVLWVDLETPTEFESECLVEIFNFHPLAVEDCLSDHSEPKMDDYDDYLFLVMHSVKMVYDDEREVEELTTVELDVFFGKNYVVTFQKTPVRTISQIRKAVARRADRFMGHGSDLLLHAIVDRLVDDYQPLLDRYDKRIDEMEEEVFDNPPADYLSEIMQTKRDIFNLRRIISPQRDLLNNITRTGMLYIRHKHLMYFRDVYDHLYRIYRVSEGFHDNLSNILQAYFAYSSHKANEIVKHMTVLATLTMPAVIIASIYGMNFKHMPELDWQLGYPFSIGLSFLTSGALLLWMKMKNWI